MTVQRFKPTVGNVTATAYCGAHPDGEYIEYVVLQPYIDRIAALEAVLRDLLEQIDSLDDISLTRDTEPYKAQACWDDTLSRVRAALETDTKPQASNETESTK